MSRVSPFCPPRRKGSSTAPAFLRCRTLRPRSDPCVAHVVIPTDYYASQGSSGALRIPSQAAKRLVKKFSKRKEQKGLVSRVSPFCPPRPRLINSARLLALSDLATAFRSVCSPCRNPNRLLRHERFEIPSQAAKRLVKNSQSKAKKDSCHESAPFALRVIRLINSARLLALSDLATAFRSVCSPCRNPNRLLRHERFENSFTSR